MFEMIKSRGEEVSSSSQFTLPDFLLSAVPAAADCGQRGFVLEVSNFKAARLSARLCWDCVCVCACAGCWLLGDICALFAVDGFVYPWDDELLKYGL